MTDTTGTPAPSAESWETFRQTGMLWMVNRTLHIFGWSIVVEYDDNDKPLRAYPAQTEWKGFPRNVDDANYDRIDNWLAYRFADKDMQKLRAWAQRQIDDIEADDRLTPEADVRTNAPLALIQMGMKGKLAILRTIIEGVPDEREEGA